MKRPRFATYYERCVLPLREKYRKEQREAEARAQEAAARAEAAVVRSTSPAATSFEERECDRRELLERKLCVLEELLADQEIHGPQENIAQLFYVAVEIGQETYLADPELVMRIGKAQILAEELHDRVFP